MARSRTRPVEKRRGRGRHHYHETNVQRAVTLAAQMSGIAKRVSCHTFHHSFATDLLERGHKIRTVQELLGHRDVSTPMIYTHILRHGARSPWIRSDDKPASRTMRWRIHINLSVRSLSVHLLARRWHERVDGEYHGTPPKMALPLHKRDFDVFLSYAHADQAFVSSLYDWLTQVAGFTVWYDARDLAGGARLATDLQKAIERCRNVILIATDEALSRGWVKAEYNAAMDEHANYDPFRVILLRLGGSRMKDVMRGNTWIDVPSGRLDAETAVTVLRAFYPGERRPNPTTSRDVYVSCSWHHDDGTSARAVSAVLIEQGFRLIGDEKDQKGFGQGDRVETIISSCGALVCILPYRGVSAANAADRPYKYFLKEIDFAIRLGLPTLVIADPRVSRSDASHDGWRRMDTNAKQCPEDVTLALTRLWEEWVAPPKPQYVFCALDLDAAAARANSPISLGTSLNALPVCARSSVRMFTSSRCSAL